MADIHILLKRLPTDRLLVRCTLHDHAAEATPTLPDAETINDLLSQARAGSQAAASVLAEVLGALLYRDGPGAILRASTGSVVLLEAEDDLAAWPWELALDPTTGRCPVAQGMELVRTGGPAAAPGPRGVPRAILVVPRVAGPARLEALVAATHPLARKAHLEVFPADPATGPALRRQLSLGAALVHLEGLVGEDRVELDDGRVPLDRLGLEGSTWLAVMGGLEAAPTAAYSLRRQGVQVVLGRQLDLEPHAAASADREFYRVLASGADPVEAVRRARLALVSACGLESFRWAAPVLWSAVAEDGALPARVPFPPPVPAALLEAEPAPSRSTATEITRAVLTLPIETPPPVPAPVFVRDTVRLLQAGIDPVDPEVEDRVATLRNLGAGLDLDPTPPPTLAPEQRTTWLADRLVDAVGRADLPLLAPADLDARVRRGAAEAGAAELAVRRLSTALVAARAALVLGDGGRALAEVTAQRVFGFQTTHVACGRDTALVGGPAGDNPHEGDGWLYRSIALNWRRDELDPRRPLEPRPRTRMRLVSRTVQGWEIHLGTWLVLTGVERIPPGTLAGLLAALEDGALTGFDAGGHAFRLAVPSDYRVLLVGAMPAELPAWVPVIPMGRAPASARQGRWLSRLERRVGPPGDASEAEARGEVAAQLDHILSFAAALVELPCATLGEAMLACAVESGGKSAVDEALCLFLAPRLAQTTLVVRRALRAWLSGDRQTLLAAAREGHLLAGMAAFLDDLEAGGQLGLAEQGPTAWLTEPGLDAPSVAVPGFLRLLSRS